LSGPDDGDWRRIQQSHVLDGDDSLIGEGLEQPALLGCEAVDVLVSTPMPPIVSPSRSMGVA